MKAADFLQAISMASRPQVVEAPLACQAVLAMFNQEIAMNLTMYKRVLLNGSVSVLMLVLAGCGAGESPPTGGGSPVGAIPPDGTPTPPSGSVSENVGGHLFGELFLDDGSNTAYPVLVLMANDGRFRVVASPYSDSSTELLLRGSFQRNERQISGDGIAVSSPGTVWSDGNSVTDVSISGTLDQPSYTDQGRLLINVAMASGDSGRIDAKFPMMSGYWFGSDWSVLNGSWRAEQDENGTWYPYYPDENMPPPGYFQIDVATGGEFSGVDDDGCNAAGHFSLIDTRYGLWAVEYTISSCDRAGNYSGLVLRDNGWYSTRSLFVSVDDGTHSLVLEFWESPL